MEKTSLDCGFHIEIFSSSLALVASSSPLWRMMSTHVRAQFRTWPDYDRTLPLNSMHVRPVDAVKYFHFIFHFSSIRCNALTLCCCSSLLSAAVMFILYLFFCESIRWKINTSSARILVLMFRALCHLYVHRVHTNGMVLLDFQTHFPCAQIQRTQCNLIHKPKIQCVRLTNITTFIDKMHFGIYTYRRANQYRNAIAVTSTLG